MESSESEEHNPELPIKKAKLAEGEPVEASALRPHNVLAPATFAPFPIPQNLFKVDAIPSKPSTSSPIVPISSSEELTRDATRMTLDQFMSKYTSEDDASFSRLLDKQVSVARKAYQEAYDEASKVHKKILAGGRTIGWKHYDPSHASVMSYPHTSVELQSTSSATQSLGEKTIIPENTRFPEEGPSWAAPRPSDQSSNENTQFKSPSMPAPRQQGQPMDAQIYATMLQGSSPSSRPIMPASSYSMVSTPRLLPGEVDQSPLVTWGEVMEGGAVPLSALPGPGDDISTAIGSSVTSQASAKMAGEAEGCGAAFTVPPLSSARSASAAALLSQKKQKSTPSHNALLKAAMRSPYLSPGQFAVTAKGGGGSESRVPSSSPRLAASSTRAQPSSTPLTPLTLASPALFTPDLQLRSSYVPSPSPSPLLPNKRPTGD